MSKNRKHRRKRWVERHPGASHASTQDVADLPPAGCVMDLFAYGPTELIERHIHSAAEIKEFRISTPCFG